MKKLSFLIWVMILSTCTLFAIESQAQTPRPVAFTHAVIIDGNGGTPVENGILIVRGDKIEAVGSAETVKIPVDAEVRDLKGKVLMPGLADMHLHLVGGWDGESAELLGYQRYLNALLYSGVTTVLDAGNVMPYVIQLRDEIAAGRLAGPRIYCAGPLLDGANPIWRPISYSITSVDQVPGIVRELKQNRVDLIKAYAGLSDQLMAALTREALKNSLPVLVDQGFRNGSIELVMGGGVTMFAHLPDFPPGVYYGAETMKMMKRRGVRFTSTLSVVESYSKRRLADLSFLESPLIKDTVPASFIEALRSEAGRELDERGRAAAATNLARFKQRAANAKLMFDAGFLIAAGTDAPYPGVFQGEGLHHELELLVEVGLRPIDAITMATRNAAQFIGANDWGTLEPGKQANILVINGRPDQKIRDTRNIELVMKDGKIIDREKLKLNPKTDPDFRPAAPVKAG
jgi:imidazolonepropionase-like amidohydrolase